MKTYLLKIAHRSVRIEVSINDVLLHSAAPEGEGTLAVNEWLRPGDNLCTINLYWPDGVSYAPGLASAEISITEIVSDDSGMLPPESRVVASWNWPERTGEGYPHFQKLAFAVPAFPNLALWTETTPVTSLTPDDRAAIEAVVLKLAGAFRSGGFGAAQPLLERKGQDLDIAYGRPVGFTQGSLAQLDVDLGWQSGINLEPIPAGRLDFQLVAEGRLAWVTLAASSLFRESELGWEMHVYCAKCGGVWGVLR